MDCPRRRRLNSILLVAAFFYCSASAEELVRAKVTGDSVNVRVRPEINSEIVTQLSAGEEVVVLERGDEWTKILAPSHSKCWVHSETVSGSIIKSDSVNLRCGPGLAFPVMAKLKNGTKIDIIEVFGEWVRIEPPVEFGLWVNSKYLEYAQTEVWHPEGVVEEKPRVVSVAEEEITGVELVSYAGRLEDLGIIINRPGTYKLVSDDKWVCIIKAPTLDVNPYVNRMVRIEGVLLSKSSSWNVPIIELKRLSLIK